MPSSADYNELLPVIQAMSPETVVTPTVPVDVFVQEAENLAHWCTSDQEAEVLWKAEASAAFNMRDSLLHAFRYAFRKDAGLLARLDEIALGDTNADMVQDLNDLSILGKAHLDLLMPINIAPIALDDAAETSDRMADLLGATNGERKEVSEAMIIRDKAYTYLKLAVDEIRECGKFVFWRNPDRLKGYVSDYWKSKNAIKENASAATPA